MRAAALLAVLVLGWSLPMLGFTTAAPAAAHVTATQQRDEPLARLEVETLSPRVVTAGGPAVLTVTGEIVNTGDRRISDLGVRVQRDRVLTGPEEVAAALESVPDAPVITRFTSVATDLEPGQSTPFRVELPLGTGPELQALQITEPGVYPLLVNLNGTPDFGGAARLAAVPLLLPVLDLPQPGPAPPDEVPPVPAPVTVVWPLAVETARVPSGPGEPLRLRSPVAGTDPMAEQFAPGGRLDGLLAALEEAVPPGSPLAGGLCVAVGPALLETATGMAAGYQVLGPTGITEGTGGPDAQRWLDRLRGVVAGRCVLPLPYGDPDLVALSRAGLADLEALGISRAATIVEDVLGVQPVTGVAWPADGVLDQRTLADLAALGTGAALMEPTGVSPPPVDGDTVTLPDDTRALLADPLLTTALEPAVPQTLESGTLDLDAPSSAVAARPTGTGQPLAAQDALGALAFRALAEDRRPVLLVPPRRWQADAAEATALLRTAVQLVDAGYLTPRDLPGLVESPVPGPPAALDYPVQAGAEELPTTVTSEITRARDVLRDLQAATERDATVNLEPAALLDPLRFGLLRAASTAWRDEPARAAELVGEVTDELERLRGSVRIVPPAGPYTLASSDAPLLITVQNDLPVSVDVRLDLEETAGLRTGAVGVQQVPARSNRQFVIPAEAVRAGRFSVDARLTTPDGMALGSPSTLQLESTAFGTVTVAITVGAGALLVLLVARRIVRRIRSARAAESAGTEASGTESRENGA